MTDGEPSVMHAHPASDDGSTFACRGNLEKPRVVCADVLTKYKHERRGRSISRAAASIASSASARDTAAGITITTTDEALRAAFA